MSVIDWGVFRVHVGDCIASMASMPAESVRCCVTSPPYFGLRDYGHEGQIGLDETPDAFVQKIVEVAVRHGRVGVLCEINPDYAQLAVARVHDSLFGGKS